MLLKPKIRKINLDLDINDLIIDLSKYSGFSILDSCKRDNWTIIGIKPFKILSLQYNQDPWRKLSKILNKYQVKKHKKFPILVGGIGYFAYELNQTLEKLPQPQSDDMNLPDLYFNFYKNLLLYNNKTKEFFVSYCDQNFYDFILKLNRKKTPALVKAMAGKKKINLKSNLAQRQYNNKYKQVKHYIKIGDVYQINLAQRLETKIKQDPFDIFLKLKKQNPAPYAAYLGNDKFKIISSSPELFLKLDKNNIETRPIKGTVPRGRTKKQDLKYKKWLLASKKDKAELDMITDLARNDLSKVSKTGTVKVKEQREIIAWPTIWHTESKIMAKLDNKYNNIDLIKACFPCGSITGCPKIRAMEIIRELEPHRRLIYTGSVGYLSFSGDLELNVAIRTMIYKENSVYFSVGGGLVSDSQSDSEYQETFDKAKALIKAIK